MPSAASALAPEGPVEGKRATRLLRPNGRNQTRLSLRPVAVPSNPSTPTSERGKPAARKQAKTLGFPLTLEGCESQRPCLTPPSASQACRRARRLDRGVGLSDLHWPCGDADARSGRLLFVCGSTSDGCFACSLSPSPHAPG